MVSALLTSISSSENKLIISLFFHSFALFCVLAPELSVVKLPLRETRRLFGPAIHRKPTSGEAGESHEVSSGPYKFPDLRSQLNVIRAFTARPVMGLLPGVVKHLNQTERKSAYPCQGK